MIKEQVIRGERTGIGKAFGQMIEELDMPIYKWSLEQDIKRKKIKL